MKNAESRVWIKRIERQPHQGHDYYRNKQPPPSEKKLLSETDLTLEFAIMAGQTTEATRRQVELQRKPEEVNFTKSEKKKKNIYQLAKKRPEDSHSPTEKK